MVTKDKHQGREPLGSRETNGLCIDKMFLCTDSVINLFADKADCTVSIGDDDFVKLMTGKLNPQTVSLKTLVFELISRCERLLNLC